MTPACPSNPVTRTPKKKQKRRDDLGRAYAGSQLQIQIWANCRQSELSAAVCDSLALPAKSDVAWISPVAPKFREFKDGAFLRALGLADERNALNQFWPRGGPVWDGLAIAETPSRERVFVLVEAKSYPNEVVGSGCQAVAGTPSRTLIEKSLDATAQWLGVQRTDEWLGALYQSANRLAHIYFLRERHRRDARMLNLCFEADPRSPTDRPTWIAAHARFKKALGVDRASLPWLTELYLPAGERSELLAVAI
jgi:hypothetical protein